MWTWPGSNRRLVNANDVVYHLPTGPVGLLYQRDLPAGRQDAAHYYYANSPFVQFRIVNFKLFYHYGVAVGEGVTSGPNSAGSLMGVILGDGKGLGASNSVFCGAI